MIGVEADLSRALADSVDDLILIVRRIDLKRTDPHDPSFRVEACGRCRGSVLVSLVPEVAEET